MPDKLSGFTQSSYPAFVVMPSDEDYKTPVFAIVVQSWAKVSALPNLQ